MIKREEEVIMNENDTVVILSPNEAYLIQRRNVKTLKNAVQGNNFTYLANIDHSVSAQEPDKETKIWYLIRNWIAVMTFAV
uniref:Uncharacterized protein n=1 Tax=Romanomermis culicivorax TaxID=13658 RepID=A0A915JSK4_ROMCU